MEGDEYGESQKVGMTGPGDGPYEKRVYRLTEGGCEGCPEDHR